MDIQLETKKYYPELYEIHEILDQKIVGEYEARMSLFTNWYLSCQNILMSGSRSSGKTWISDHIRKYFIGEKCYTITSGSEKSAWGQAEAITKSSHILILELNQIPKEFIEVLKQWGEGKEAEYRVTVVAGGVRTFKSYKLPPKPYVFCVADEEGLKKDEQLWSRLTVIRTDDSMLQNKKVLEEQARVATVRKNVKIVDEELIQKILLHLESMPDFYETRFNHPAAKIFIDSIPHFFTDCRRDFPKYLANVAGICRFYYKDRMSLKEGEETTFLITPQDMVLNHLIYGNILVESSLKCNNLQRKMIDIMKQLDYSMTAKELQKQLRINGVNVSTYMVSRHLKELSEVGYLDADKSSDNKTNTYTRSGMLDEFELDIDWKKVVSEILVVIKKEFPEQFEEYKKRFCVNPTITHPFTGETINILTHDFSLKTKDKLKVSNVPTLKKSMSNDGVVEEQTMFVEEETVS